MHARLLTLAAVTLAACSAGRYEWRPARGPMNEQQLQADIAACEDFRAQSETKGPKASSTGARPYGGWGDFSFEFCMEKRGWALQLVRPGVASAPSAPQAAAPSASIAPPAPPAAPAPAPAGASGPPGGAGGPVKVPYGACPATVPGTRIAVGDTDDGEAITFTAYPERLDELRRRVRALAELQGAQPVDAPRLAPGAGAGDPPALPRSRVTVEDVTGGARLVITPEDAADLPRVRAAVRAQADRMRETGTCEGHGGAG